MNTKDQVAEWVKKTHHVPRQTIVVFEGLVKGEPPQNSQYEPLPQEEFDHMNAALKALFEIHPIIVEGPNPSFQTKPEGFRTDFGRPGELEFLAPNVFFKWTEKYGRAVERLLGAFAEEHQKWQVSLSILFIEPDATYTVPVRAMRLTEGYVSRMETPQFLRDLNELAMLQERAEKRQQRIDAGEDPEDIDREHYSDQTITAIVSGKWATGKEVFAAATEHLGKLRAVSANPYTPGADGIGAASTAV